MRFDLDFGISVVLLNLIFDLFVKTIYIVLTLLE